VDHPQIKVISGALPVRAIASSWRCTRAEAIEQDYTTVFHMVNAFTRVVAKSPLLTVMREGTVVGLANHTLVFARYGTEWPIDDSGAPIRNRQDAVVGVV